MCVRLDRVMSRYIAKYVSDACDVVHQVAWLDAATGEVMPRCSVPHLDGVEALGSLHGGGEAPAACVGPAGRCGAGRGAGRKPGPRGAGHRRGGDPFGFGS